jgi:hypothetical protein
MADTLAVELAGNVEFSSPFPSNPPCYILR